MSQDTRGPEIKNIQNAAIKRLSQVAGCKRLSEDSYEITKTILNNMLIEILERCFIYMEYAKRKTLYFQDLEAAISDKIYGSEDTEFKSCRNLETRRGSENCLYVAHETFRRTVKDILAGLSDTGIRLSEGFIGNLQAYVERKLIDILAKANSLAVEVARRITVTGADIAFIHNNGCVKANVSQEGMTNGGQAQSPRKRARSPKSTGRRRSPNKTGGQASSPKRTGGQASSPKKTGRNASSPKKTGRNASSPRSGGSRNTSSPRSGGRRTSGGASQRNTNEIPT
jgi:histone H3/H4